MTMIFKNISLYWKSQLIGWTVFTVVVYLFNSLIYHEGVKFITFAVSIFIFGLLSTHLLKIAIKKFQLLKQRFAKQIFSLITMATVFSIFGTFVWMAVMIKAGLWVIEGENRSEWIVDFFEEFFFNLFPVLMTLSGWVLIYFLFHYVRDVRRAERLKIKYKLQKTVLEAKALRAQMNPHFIFNCMNSIKALIQNDEKKASIDYLTIFSKLIRTLFQNSDKGQITLYDEIETSRLYTQLEAMRLNGKMNYQFNIDPDLDLKSVMVPALIIQPFIENAIWHGIVPKEKGSITISAKRGEGVVICEVDDDGIGRETSKLNKPITPVIHESKGVHLTQQRLHLEKRLNESNSSIEIIDKYENNEPVGTKVVITFSIQ
ncbi:MAG TPA: histidine kinase [Chitinophagaceae bacterium]|nr:histidine kinase [Chitinophagaceae bacterium]